MRGTLLLMATLVAAPLVAGCTSSGNGTLTVAATDAPDNLGDFSALTVTVSAIEVFGANGPTSYAPSTPTFDLTKLTSGNVSTLFSGPVPPGNYSKLQLDISSGTGTLKSGGAADVKAPGGKLFLALAFTVASGKETKFTFDIQVVKLGNGGYNFQPNATGSKAA
ncbi:MAG: DUF4382 domain-containing protein [Thermoplasmatota archaeon]